MRMARWTAAVTAGLLAAVLHAAPEAQGGGQRGAGEGRGTAAPAGAQAAAPMRLMSNSFIDGGLIPLKYTQAGEQASPQLAWANAPVGTQSFVLHMHDMEGARNKTSEDQLHWLVWNIPATTRALPEGLPKGVWTFASSCASNPGMEYRPLPPMIPISAVKFRSPE